MTHYGRLVNPSCFFMYITDLKRIIRGGLQSIQTYGQIQLETGVRVLSRD
jgi:hypothetical protein